MVGRITNMVWEYILVLASLITLAFKEIIQA